MKIRVVIHVDDLLCAGGKENLEKFRKDLMKEYELRHTYLGPASPDRSVRGLRASNESEEEQREGSWVEPLPGRGGDLPG